MLLEMIQERERNGGAGASGENYCQKEREGLESSAQVEELALDKRMGSSSRVKRRED